MSLEEEYAIYSTVLRKIAGYPRMDPSTGEYPLPGMVVLIDRTGLGDYKNAESGTLSRHLSTAMSLDVGPLVDDLLDNNRTPLVLENRFNLPVEVVLVSEDTLAAIFGSFEPHLDSAWQAFSDRYPDSRNFLELSRPGVDSRGRALLYVAAYCGEVCGIGYFYLLHRVDGEWAVARARWLWIS